MNTGVSSGAQRLDSAENEQTGYGGGDYVHPARQAGMGAPQEPSAALHNKLDELSHQLNTMVSRQAPAENTFRAPMAAPPAQPAEAPMMQALIERIEQSERASSTTMDALNQRLSELAGKLAENSQTNAPAPSAQVPGNANFEQAIKSVMDHVEQAEQRNRDVIKSMQDRMAEMGARAASSPTGPVKESADAILALENRLSELARKLDQQDQDAATHPRIATIESKLNELANRVQPDGGSLDSADSIAARISGGENPGSVQGAGGLTRADLSAVEQRVESLAQQIQTQSTALPVAEGENAVARHRNDLAQLTEQVRQIKASAASNRDLQSMRASLENLTKQVSRQDTEQPFDILHQRITELAHNLQNSLPSPEERSKVGDLEAKVLQLDARISAAQAQPDNTTAVKALEANVKQISDRLGEQERRVASIAQIEASIAQLTSKLHTSRNEAATTAELAAIRMADQLRVEVDEKTNQLETAPAKEEISALHQGLQAVQTQTQSSDQRTHETLLAVHDTLDSVIERMNQIEAAKASVSGVSSSPLDAPAGSNTVQTIPASSESAPAQSAFAAPATEPVPAAPAATDLQTGAPDSAAQAAGPGQSAFAAPAIDAAAPVNPAQGIEQMQPTPLRADPIPATPVGAPPSIGRQDFIAAAREAARAAGHSPEAAQSTGRTTTPKKAAAPALQLGAQQAEASSEEVVGSKKGKLLLAGTLALLTGAVAAYIMLNRPGGPVQSSSPPKITRPAPSTAPAPARVETPAPAAQEVPGGANAGTEEPVTVEPKASDGVQPAESVPFDPTAPAQSSSLQESDPIQTATISNSSGKTGRPDSTDSAQLPANAQPDSNITTIGKVAQNAGGSSLEALSDLSNQAANSTALPESDPFITGSIPSNAATSNVSTGAPAPSEAAFKAAALPKALGPEGMLRAAVAGDSAAQFMVATRFSDGKAVPKDFDKAAAWYHKAASKGLAPAQYRLGTFFERGRGVKRDIKTAKNWYEHAAHRGHIKAMHNLAVLLANGSDGAPQFKQANYWFKKAANLGLKDSQYNLAILYEQGLGEAKDLTEAYRWYALAAKQRDKDAKKRMNKLAKVLSPDQLAKAKTMTESWRPIRAKFAANVVTPPIGGWETPDTQQASKPASPSTSAASLPPDAILQAQKLLNAIGIDAGVADGQMGPKTANAIRDFQRQNSLAPTGKVTPELLKKLRNLPG